MVDNTRPGQTRDPFDRFDEAISDPRLYETSRYEQPYELPYERSETLHEERLPHEPVPLFLSSYEEEHYQQLSEYAFASGHRKKVRVSRIVAAVVAVSAIGGLLALFSIELDALRHRQRQGLARRRGARSVRRGGAGARAGFGAAAAARRRTRIARTRGRPTGSVSGSPQLPPDGHDGQRVGIGIAVTRRNYRRLSERGQGQGRRARAGGARSRPRGRPGCAGNPRDRPPPREAAPARRIDPDELAALLKRAKGLLAIGDITSARLLLERAADAQEPEAALMLAGTYDPQVLGSQDLRSVTADPAAARVWYQKAAQLGSADAKRRLGQLQN